MNGTPTGTTTFWYEIIDKFLGRENPDGTFDTLVSDGTWVRGVEGMNKFICSEVTREQAARIAADDGAKAGLDDPPIPGPDEMRDSVPLTDDHAD